MLINVSNKNKIHIYILNLLRSRIIWGERECLIERISHVRFFDNKSFIINLPVKLIVLICVPFILCNHTRIIFKNNFRFFGNFVEPIFWPRDDIRWSPMPWKILRPAGQIAPMSPLPKRHLTFRRFRLDATEA